MKLADELLSTGARSWSRRVERRRLTKVDYSSELRSWVQLAILKAEEMNDSDKKGKFLSLLKEL